MAQVQLADIIEPELFTDYVRQRTTELSAFFASGIIQQTDLMNQLVADGSTTFNVPFWNATASDEPNVGSDAPGTTSTPKKITAASQVGIKQYRNQSWSAMDLVAAVAGSDPMNEIVNNVASYWARVLNKNALQILQGIIADNIANDSGDMVYSIATDAALPVLAAETVSPDAIISAWATMGDHSGDLAGMAMHSTVYHNLQKQDVITFRPASEQNVMIPQYLGKDVVVDDTMPAIAGTNRITYWTALFGRGAFGYGEGNPRLATEVDRIPAAGNGAGQEVLFSRRHFGIHPGGFKWLSGSMAGTTPTNAELALAANWDRVFDRKNIPIALLKTNA